MTDPQDDEVQAGLSTEVPATEPAEDDDDRAADAADDEEA